MHLICNILDQGVGARERGRSARARYILAPNVILVHVQYWRLRMPKGGSSERLHSNSARDEINVHAFICDQDMFSARSIRS